jgi:acetamidase/formamidase
VLHVLDPVRGHVTDRFCASDPPAVTIDSGDRLLVRTLDGGGHLEPWRRLGQERQLLFPDGGHCLAGPVAVRGAEPGNFLAVHLESLTPGDWGYTIAGFRDDPLNRHLGTAGGEPGFLSWQITDGRATDQRGLSLPIAPFLGVIGTAPAEPGEHSTVPPRTGSAGNIDCKLLSPVARCSCRSTSPAGCCASATGTPRRATARWAARRSSVR